MSLYRFSPPRSETVHLRMYLSSAALIGPSRRGFQARGVRVQQDALSSNCACGGGILGGIRGRGGGIRGSGRGCITHRGILDAELACVIVASARGQADLTVPRLTS